MDSSRSGKLGLKQLAQGGALCGVPISGVMPTSMLGAAAPGELLSLALVAGGFVGAGVWMFRKWSNKPSVTSPEETPDARPEQGRLATS